MAQQSNDQVLSDLWGEVDNWVTGLLQSHHLSSVRDGKVIRDGVHGFQHLSPHEVAIVDTPVVQRLRFIHQTALAHLIYPTMTHTRFDHSLGMTFVANSMIRSLQAKHREAISERDVQIVRLAALLHDTGHTIFSHMGEGILEYRFSDLFDQIRRATLHGKERFFEEASSGEILSYLIITCPTMRQFLEDRFVSFQSDGCELDASDIDVIAGLIVGSATQGQQYLADIINGPVDADKLDYIRRDCHFSGIRAEIDVPRIIFGLDWITQGEQSGHLCTDSSVIPQLEQILLAKLMLYTSIYHHHKVRAVECAMKSIFHSLLERTPTRALLRFESVTDFLRLHEFQFLAWGLEEPSISSQVLAILNRDLLKRALVINPHTVDRRSHRRLTRLRSSLSDEQSLGEARAKIFYAMPEEFRTELHELWLDIPKGPDTDEEAQLCFVRFGDQVQTLAETLPTDDWVQAYQAHKLNYFVFYNAEDARRKCAADKASEYLNEEFEIVVEPLARSLAHL